MSNLKSTTLRDFSGGWNALDSDLNLAGQYQPVLDNVYRGLDNTLSVRQGYELFSDMRGGVETTGSGQSVTFGFTNASNKVTVAWTGHPFANGNHFTITNSITTFGGLVLDELIDKAHGIIKVDADNFYFYIRSAATSTSTAARTIDWKKDTHILAGNIIGVSYFSDFLIIVDDRGEIAKVNATGTATVIWNTYLASLTTGAPAGWTEMVFTSSDIFKGQLIVVNGQDKPLVIDFTIANPVQYLVDAGSGSNVNTPIAKYVAAVGRWLVMAGDPTVPNRIHIGATDAVGTFYGDAAPNDGLYLDVNYTTNSPSFVIRGISKFRDQLVVAFDDAIVPVTLGIFDTSTPPVHKPDITDVVSRFGAIAHKSMIFLGFDLLMCDPVGVPSLARSMYNNQIVPARQSTLIGPPLQKNISRLSTATLSDNVFAVYSTYDFQYILFMPDYDDDTLTMDNDPFFVPDSFVGTGKIVVKKLAHGQEIGDKITLSGATDFAGITAATYINTQQTVSGVLNENYFLIEVGANSTVAANGGGASVSMTRNKNETTAYAFTYNANSKTRTWARYRGMNFNAGCVSVYGRVFLATDDRIWRMGTTAEPVYADFYNNYDAIWATTTAYTVGQKIYDNVTKQTFTCLVAHTSGSGTFAEDREATPTNWELYVGEAIDFTAETPWADYGERTRLKVLQYLGVDALGDGPFTIQCYADYYYRSKLDGTMQPQLSLDFVGGEAGGFGVGD